MHAEEYTATVQCPDCGVDIEVQCSLLVDPGCRYHVDGSGTPPSEDFNAEIPEYCPGCKREFTVQQMYCLADNAREAAPDDGRGWDGPEPDDLEPPDSWFDE